MKHTSVFRLLVVLTKMNKIIFITIILYFTFFYTEAQIQISSNTQSVAGKIDTSYRTTTGTLNFNDNTAIADTLEVSIVRKYIFIVEGEPLKYYTATAFYDAYKIDNVDNRNINKFLDYDMGKSLLFVRQNNAFNIKVLSKEITTPVKFTRFIDPKSNTSKNLKTIEYFELNIKVKDKQHPGFGCTVCDGFSSFCPYKFYLERRPWLKKELGIIVPYFFCMWVSG